MQIHIEKVIQWSILNLCLSPEDGRTRCNKDLVCEEPKEDDPMVWTFTTFFSKVIVICSSHNFMFLFCPYNTASAFSAFDNSLPIIPCSHFGDVCGLFVHYLLTRTLLYSFPITLSNLCLNDDYF